MAEYGRSVAVAQAVSWTPTRSLFLEVILPLRVMTLGDRPLALEEGLEELTLVWVEPLPVLQPLQARRQLREVEELRDPPRIESKLGARDTI